MLKQNVTLQIMDKADHYEKEKTKKLLASW